MAESTDTEPTEAEPEPEESAEGEEAEAAPDAYSCEIVESDVWKSGEEPHHGGSE
jgi:hypothetical protein